MTKGKMDKRERNARVYQLYINFRYIGKKIILVLSFFFFYNNFLQTSEMDYCVIAIYNQNQGKYYHVIICGINIYELLSQFMLISGIQLSLLLKAHKFYINKLLQQQFFCGYTHFLLIFFKMATKKTRNIFLTHFMLKLKTNILIRDMFCQRV